MILQKLIKLLFYTFVIVSLNFCSNSKVKEEAVKEIESADSLLNISNAKLNHVKISFTSVQKKSINEVIKVNGKIDVPPQNMISISITLGGYLKSTNLLPGVHVKKGEVIAILEDPQYIQLQQDYLIALSKLKTAKLEFDRQAILNQSKAGSDKAFQQAQSDYDILKININALSEKLKLINIVPEKLSVENISKEVKVISPINGFVSKVNVNIGKYVNPSEVLFELINPEDIHLNLKVFEKDLPKLYINQKLNAFTNFEPENKHRCEIILISKDLSIERTADVHCHFLDYDKALLPGMYLSAEIESQSKESYVLPLSAILNYQAKHFVFIKVNSNSFLLKQVTIGSNNKTEVEILNYKDIISKEIVLQGNYDLLMDLKNSSKED
ncbi:MAG: efflux RND transporter periplasmic adaptor subunit [Bacteroidetes bacterium]|nr:efflux RND transporter periplasmic adaptor subunit [Bacteroidota bacterium]